MLKSIININQKSRAVITQSMVGYPTLPASYLAVRLFRMLLFTFVLFAPMFLSAQQTKYSYTGNSFSSISGVFSTSDYISGFFIVNNPLTSTSLIQSFTPQSFSFTAGPLTLTNTNSNYSFKVKTSAAGVIEAWTIDMINPNLQSERIVTFKSAPPSITGTDTAIYYDSSVKTNYNASVSNPGTWVKETIAVPEPTTALLLASGSAITAFLRKRMNKRLS